MSKDNNNNYTSVLQQLKNSSASSSEMVSQLDALLNQSIPDTIRLKVLVEKLKHLTSLEQKSKVFESILPLSKLHSTPDEQLTLLADYATHTLFAVHNLKKAIQLYNEVIRTGKLYPTLEFSTPMARAYNALGLIFHHTNYEETSIAFKYYKQSLDIFMKTDDNYGLSTVTNNIGLIYKRNKEYDKALHEFKKALNYIISSGEDNPYFPLNVQKYKCNITECLIECRDFEQGLIHLKETEAAMLNSNINDFMWVNIHYNYGILNKYQGDYKTAEAYFNKMYEVSSHQQFRFKAQAAIGSLYFEQQKYAEALPYYESALVMLQEIDLIYEQDKIYKRISQIHEYLGNYKACIEAYKNKETAQKKKNDDGKTYYLMMLENELDTMLKSQEIKFQAKLNEQLQRSNEELSNFAHQIAHDLKEPLRMINSYANILNRRLQNLDNTSQEFFDYIKNSSNRMSDMINAILEFALLDNNVKAAQKVTLDNCVELAKHNLRYTFQKASVAFKSEDLPVISGHKTLLVILFQNLLANAIKFRKTSIPSSINVTRKSSDKFHIINITDNGIGMNEQNQKHIFDMFYRSENKKKYDGLGIGLATCKKIMDIHQGKIEVESTLGEGTTFSLFFPLRKVD